MTIANDLCNFNAYHVVTANNVTAATILDGFEITGGFADFNAPISRGGGMLVSVGPPEFISNPVIIRCTFIDNYALEGGGLSGSPGEGLATQPQIVNCSFIENQAQTNGGAAHAVRSTLSFVNCLFVGNLAEQGDGGAIYDGTNDGGTNTEVINCTLTENDAPNGEGGGIFSDGASSATVTNSIVWANSHSGSADETAQIFGTATVTYCCIQDESPGDGNPPFADATNIDLDPLFVDPGDPGENYRLAGDSPCIEVGDPNEDVIPDDTFDVNQDGNTTEPTPDLDLGDRIVGGTVDMGAYESVPCPADLDGSCDVGVKDLILLLGVWGPCEGCPADLDGPGGVPGNPVPDGVVGVHDLLFLIGAWGPCPCAPLAEVLSLQEELADACLTMDDWDDFADVMTDPESSQADKDRYNCWMIHLLDHCNNCTCTHKSECPNPNPFN